MNLEEAKLDFDVPGMRALWKREGRSVLRSRNLNSQADSSHTTPLAVAINASFYNWLHLTHEHNDHLVLRIQREPRITFRDTFTFVFSILSLYLKGLFAPRSKKSKT